MSTPVVRFTHPRARDFGALKAALMRFITVHGWSAPELLERTGRQWYGSFNERATLLDACTHDGALLEACEIIQLAGPLAAKVLPFLVHRYLSGASAEGCA
jgi:hypothetical protein